MKLQPTLVWRQPVRERLLRLVGLKVKRYDRTDGSAYLAYSESFSVTLIFTKYPT